MSDNFTTDIYSIERTAKQKLKDYAIEVLREEKLITKAFSYDFPFFMQEECSYSLYKLFSILIKEFKKQIQYAKYLPGNFELITPTTVKRNTDISVNIPTIIAARYCRYMNYKLSKLGFLNMFSYHGEVKYAGWDPIGKYTIIRFNHLSFVGAGTGNPYRLFNHLDDILKVFRTLSRVLVIINTEANPKTILPVYQTLRDMNTILRSPNDLKVIPKGQRNVKQKVKV